MIFVEKSRMISFVPETSDTFMIVALFALVERPGAILALPSDAVAPAFTDVLLAPVILYSA